MADNRLAQISARIDEADPADPASLATYLEEHDRWLRDEGQFKLLAIGYFRAGQIQKAGRALRRVPAEQLTGEERRIAADIRHQRRLDRRTRIGLHLPSNKRFSRRVRDGLVNLLRHGRLRNPTSQRAPMPPSLRPVSAQVRAARQSDVRQLRALLDRHEADYEAGGHTKFLAFNYYHAGCLSKAAANARTLDPGTLSQDETHFVENIVFEWEALRRMRAGQPPIAFDEARARSGRVPERPKALYIAASSQPFIVSGYTSRSKAIVQALETNTHLELIPVTRPGFPWDRTDARQLSAARDETIAFRPLPCDQPFRGDLAAYLDAALPALETIVREEDIDIVHGVSNYRNAVIGYVLARRTGLPFVTEIRGLWEETTDTKLTGWRETERFEYERAFEAFLYAEADGALPINAQVQAVLETDPPHPNAVPLPNCVSRDQIVEHRGRAAEGKLTIGYIGSLLEYEGLDDLIEAIAMLQCRGKSVKLDIYGHGADMHRLKGLVGDGDARDVALHGAVSPERVPELYAGFDLCVFPRKPYRVCELVTPLKPLEAMANDVNVIVSDVAPMALFAEEGAALAFEAGNVEALVESLEQFMALGSSPRRDLRKRARDLLKARFVWEEQGEVVARVYRQALAAKGGLAA